MSRWSKALDEAESAMVYFSEKPLHERALNRLNTAIWNQTEGNVLRAAVAIRRYRRSLGVRVEKTRMPLNDASCFDDPVRLLWSALASLADAAYWEGHNKPEDYAPGESMAHFQAVSLSDAEASLRLWWERRPRHA